MNERVEYTYAYFIHIINVWASGVSPPPPTFLLVSPPLNTFQVFVLSKLVSGLRHLCCYSEKVGMSLYNSHSKSGDKTQVLYHCFL